MGNYKNTVLTRLAAAEQALQKSALIGAHPVFAMTAIDAQAALGAVRQAGTLITTIHAMLDHAEWDSDTVGFIADHLRGAGLECRDPDDETGMSAAELESKHSENGEHPDHKYDDWKGEVAANDTVSGYWDWVASQIEQASHSVCDCASRSWVGVHHDSVCPLAGTAR